MSFENYCPSINSDQLIIDICILCCLHVMRRCEDFCLSIMCETPITDFDIIPDHHQLINIKNQQKERKKEMKITYTDGTVIV
ncbi:hypothetical protein DERP_012997 [Dermatophagoides pteronyssinus]|uniref:Uncharacterized protein n=1 Tax=Dermatophagoides pteronyssinus TaxID=6956 RepID=A0ABQ8ISJ1_DERPT|nr:hypothetical protein DERP_012997 [Dermatophagoides pteronyssinus]